MSDAHFLVFAVCVMTSVTVVEGLIVAVSESTGVAATIVMSVVISVAVVVENGIVVVGVVRRSVWCEMLVVVGAGAVTVLATCKALSVFVVTDVLVRTLVEDGTVAVETVVAATVA